MDVKQRVYLQIPPEYVSTGPELLVLFKTDETVYEKGFEAIYSQVGPEFPQSTVRSPPASVTSGVNPAGGRHGNEVTSFKTRKSTLSSLAKKQQQQLVRTAGSRRTSFY